MVLHVTPAKWRIQWAGPGRHSSLLQMHLTLSDLEQCLVPPLRLNQFMVAEAKLPNGQAVPAAPVVKLDITADSDSAIPGSSPGRSTGRLLN